MMESQKTVEAQKTPRRDARAVDSLTFNLIVLMNVLTRPFQATHGDRHGISLSEWRCIMWLAAHPGASGQDTANGIGMDRMSVSRNLRSLEAKACAERIVDDKDRKRNNWTMTAKGWDIYDDLLPGALDRDALLGATLGAEQSSELRSLVKAAQKRLEDLP